MGTVECSYDAANSALTFDLPKGVLRFTIEGKKMEGTMTLSDGNPSFRNGYGLSKLDFPANSFHFITHNHKAVSFFAGLVCFHSHHRQARSRRESGGRNPSPPR